MATFGLTERQLTVIKSTLRSKVFLSGPAGSGKTTVGIERLKFLLQEGVPAGEILVLTPQRSLQDKFLSAITSPERPPGREVTTVTFGGLARRMCELFWPLAAKAAGFGLPDLPPSFLTLETAQYHMALVARPLLDRGYFESVTIDRNRLYSQVIDNLNKSALVGFDHSEIGARLGSAYFGEPASRRIFEDAQECATRFREYCLASNLLDFSLQLEVFFNQLWVLPQVRDHLTKTYRHLIYDNPEEDAPRAHDLIRAWMPALESVLLLFDGGGGFRRFLGADPEGARALGDLCETHLSLDDSFVMSPGIVALERSLLKVMAAGGESRAVGGQTAEGDRESRRALSIVASRFYPELLDRVADEIKALISEQRLRPSEIAILGPYLSDALRFALSRRLEERGVPWRSQRPSRALREEPACRALVTLAALAHPHWKIRPPGVDVANALMTSIDGLDFVRARLLTDIVYRTRDFRLSTFAEIKPDVQERITFVLGRRFTVLRDWLAAYLEAAPLPLDHFFRRLFGELLSQSGFGFRAKPDSVRVAANLVESVRKFRAVLDPTKTALDLPGVDLGKEYLAMLEDGVISASYMEDWLPEAEQAVLIAPAYTFLMMNRPVTVQFWLDISSSGWYERLAQPLTHPYVLARSWQPGRKWLDADETMANEETLRRLVSGLLRRCKERIVVGIPEYGESGFEQRGGMLGAFQQILTGA
jgi:hypothetical protein